MLPIVTAQQLKDAMPMFLSTAHKQVALPPDAERLSLELRFRCAIADYILNSKQKTLEDRVYDLVAGMSLDVGTVIPPENGAKNQSPQKH